MRLPRREFIRLAALGATAAAVLTGEQQDNPALPRVLLIGDSISIGYTAPTQRLLQGKASVQRIPANGGPTTNGLQNLTSWLGDGNWDVIHFNWGLHDLKLGDNGAHQVPIEQYDQNLRELVKRLKITGARLIWAGTTPVPNAEVSPPRRSSDVAAYNAVAKTIMDENHILINDLYSFALPRLQEIQQPANVHFTPEGYAQLAEQVAAGVLTALDNRRQGRAAFEQKEIFVAGRDGYHTYRIPSLVVTRKGTLLAFCEGRKLGSGDTGNIDLVLRRSFDNGTTWEPMRLIADDGPNTIGNPCPVVVDTGEILLLLTRNLGEDSEEQILEGRSKGSREVWVMASRDDGATWSNPVEITKTTKDPKWTWYATGPGCGIQLRNGRLLIPCDHAVAGSKMRRSHVIYSDDRGTTWKLGGVVGDNTNESQVVELVDGSLLINMRSYHGKNRRAIAASQDGGLTWSNVTLDPALVEPVCQASLVRFSTQLQHGKNRLLFSNPASTKREKMTVRLSYDEGKSWPVSKLLWRGPSAYSVLAALPDMSIGCLYERGERSPYENITFARFSIEWLTGGADSLRR